MDFRVVTGIGFITETKAISFLTTGCNPSTQHEGTESIRRRDKPLIQGRRIVKVDDWMVWLTDVRLERWNRLRGRAGLGSIDREQGARILMRLRDNILNSIKERIAE